MARSRRKSPFIGITNASSDKPYKRAEHQRERAKVKVAIALGKDVPSTKEFGDPWRSPKDGKQRIRNRKYMRK